MDLVQAKNLALVLMAKHGLIKLNYQFKWDNRARRFGAHQGSTRTIFLSRRLTLLNNEDEVKNTILHEIAHALDYIRNGFCYRYASSQHPTLFGKRLVHDKVWKDICKEIGCRPVRCYTDKEVVSPPRTLGARWQLVHKETGEVYGEYKRRPNHNDWSCFFIKGKPETLGNLVLISSR